MSVSNRRSRLPWLVAVAAVGLLAAAAQAAGLFEPLELALFDLRVSLRLWLGPPGRAVERVVVVAIDEPSLARIGRWPWPRSVHARLLDRLAAASPLAVGLDLVLTEPSDAEDDRMLAQAARKLPGLVLPGGDEAPYPALAQAATMLGSIHFPVDRDGRIRRLWLPARGRSAEVVPLALALVEVAAARSSGPAQVKPRLEHRGIVWLDVRRPPVSRWPARPFDLFPTYSYVDVLEGRVPPETLTGRIVIVGVTAAGATGGDRHLTALSALGPVPGVFLHANALRALLDDQPVRRPIERAPLITLTLAAAGGAAGGLVPLLLLALYSMASVVLFVFTGLWLDLAGPALALAGLQVGFGVWRFAEERGRRRRIESLFGRYVAPAVLAELLRSPGIPHPGGRRRQVSVLMADLCAFTALAERYAPEAVVETLNAYLQAMAGPILEAGGMLDKYLGDGVMAIFGAPLERPDHARQAVGCAAAILRRVQALNASRLRQGLPVLQVRVAVHAGEAVLGNVGTPDRMDYTAVGDTVNVCSRLQAEARPGEILVTRSAAEAAGIFPPARNGSGAWPERLEVAGPEPLPLRGRRDRVEVFRLAAMRTPGSVV